ncbi:MAG: HupE/UreJ family protein [Gemmatimonadales bacterium]
MNVGSTLALFLGLGIRHILDPGAIDHLLFIAALTIPYRARQWRSLLWLVTAFTVGHSLTLALATIGWLPIQGAVVELLIPVTIFLTSALTLWRLRRPGDGEPGRGRAWPLYAVTLGFGLIHGLGFSGYLRSLLGAEESIVAPLFWFNVGLEVAQLIAVATVLGATALVADRLVSARTWRLAVSGVALALSGQMIIARLAAV